jgi:hypothetical protein
LLLRDLKTIASDLNKTLPKSKQIKSGTREYMHKQIDHALIDKCQSKEYCWIQQDFIHPTKQRILEKAFRPLKPRTWYDNSRTWLNTYDILNVMQQYEELYKSFKFLGVHPIDFQKSFDNGRCIGENMCSFHISHLLNQGKTHFGMVLNQDYHHQSGSHWVAVYCNLNPEKKNFGIYYYDSVANSAQQEVVAFFKTIQQQVKEVIPSSFTKFKLQYNKIQKQFKNTECGMFSIIFLTQCAKQKYSFKFITENMYNDDDVNRVRNIIYRPRLNVAG